MENLLTEISRYITQLTGLVYLNCCQQYHGYKTVDSAKKAIGFEVYQRFVKTKYFCKVKESTYLFNELLAVDKMQT